MTRRRIKRDHGCGSALSLGLEGRLDGVDASIAVAATGATTNSCRRCRRSGRIVTCSPNGRAWEMRYPAASGENTKPRHVLRAMKENTRQGFWNGSQPPLGYRVVEIERRGGRTKKKLAVDPAEAETVRLMFKLVLEGHQGSGGTRTFDPLIKSHLLPNERWPKNPALRAADLDAQEFCRSTPDEFHIDAPH